METFSINTLVWIGILFCISQSAMFSGLNLALLGISRLRLEVEAHAGNHCCSEDPVTAKRFQFSSYHDSLGECRH